MSEKSTKKPTSPETITVEQLPKYWRVSGARRTKYNNETVCWNGLKFDSKRELADYKELLLRQSAGDIFDLKRQQWFILSSGKRPVRMKLDFTYRLANGQRVAHDSKGKATQHWRDKAKIFREKFPDWELITS